MQRLAPAEFASPLQHIRDMSVAQAVLHDLFANGELIVAESDSISWRSLRPQFPLHVDDDDIVDAVRGIGAHLSLDRRHVLGVAWVEVDEGSSNLASDLLARLDGDNA